MRFVSLADPNETATFQEALINGVPSDRDSLYVPEFIPELSKDDIEAVSGGNPFDIGRIMLAPYVCDEIPEADLDEIVRNSVQFPTPLQTVGNRYVLELTHGPTMAFKDVAASYLGAFLSHSHEQTGQPVVVVVATSGDTGGAIAEGMADREGVEVVLAYPKGKVSELQKEQLTRVADNIHSVEVDGTFVDCLKLTVEAFKNPELRQRFNLTTANSISVGRLLPQMTYYAGLTQYWPDGYDGRIVVPVGNEGNITAGLFAKMMGVPLPEFVAANNLNNYRHRYLQAGEEVPKPYVSTMSNAMDVETPKNAPRIEWLYDGDVERMKETLSAQTINGEQTANIIGRVWEEEGYLLDPHTAVAWVASRPGDIIISTAAPEKFAAEIQAATKIPIDNKRQLAALQSRQRRYETIGNFPEEFFDQFDRITS